MTVNVIAGHSMSMKRLKKGHRGPSASISEPPTFHVFVRHPQQTLSVVDLEAALIQDLHDDVLGQTWVLLLSLEKRNTHTQSH